MRPFCIACLVVILDQATKAIAVVQLKSCDSRTVINKVLSLTLVRNTGAAFGIFKDQAVLFVLISIAAVIAVTFYLLRKKTSYYLPLALVLGGTAGNLIDRLRFGYVIDFIDFHFWPVFNVADSCITIGMVLLFSLIIRGKDASRPV
jgi:signal peptidase II